MGWCSGTDIFDPVVTKLLIEYEKGRIDKQFLRETIIELRKALEDKDWDCHQESKFILHPLIKDLLE